MYNVRGWSGITRAVLMVLAACLVAALSWYALITWGGPAYIAWKSEPVEQVEPAVMECIRMRAWAIHPVTEKSDLLYGAPTWWCGIDSGFYPRPPEGAIVVDGWEPWPG